MRALFGCLAALLCALSIALAARYGYKGADTPMDGAINAVVFGAIALCACLFDAAAVRLWFMHHRLGAVAIGLIASAALVVTFTNSLGAIAGRADTTQAERTRSKDAAADDRADLKRVTAERAAMPAFAPADGETVGAARTAVASAERTRAAECGNGDPRQRGSNCRMRETEEQSKRDALASVLANKALTEKATRLDEEAAAIRARLAKAPPVQNANPLGSALEQIMGGAAAFLTAWQQAVVAAVFELCLVGVMVIYELLGQNGPGEHIAAVTPGAAPRPSRFRRLLGGWWTPKPPAEPSVAPGGAVVDMAGRGDPQASKRPAAKPTTSRAVTVSAPTGSVRAFVLDRIVPADGEHVDMRTLLNDYRTWCAGNGAEPKDLGGFVDEIEVVCKKARIKIDALPDKRVICRNVKLATLSARLSHDEGDALRRSR